MGSIDHTSWASRLTCKKIFILKPFKIYPKRRKEFNFLNPKIPLKISIDLEETLLRVYFTFLSLFSLSAALEFFLGI